MYVFILSTQIWTCESSVASYFNVRRKHQLSPMLVRVLLVELLSSVLSLLPLPPSAVVGRLLSFCGACCCCCLCLSGLNVAPRSSRCSWFLGVDGRTRTLCLLFAINSSIILFRSVFGCISLLAASSPLCGRLWPDSALSSKTSIKRVSLFSIDWISRTVASTPVLPPALSAKLSNLPPA